MQAACRSGGHGGSPLSGADATLARAAATVLFPEPGRPQSTTTQTPAAASMSAIRRAAIVQCGCGTVPPLQHCRHGCTCAAGDDSSRIGPLCWHAWRIGLRRTFSALKRLRGQSWTQITSFKRDEEFIDAVGPLPFATGLESNQQLHATLPEPTFGSREKMRHPNHVCSCNKQLPYIWLFAACFIT